MNPIVPRELFEALAGRHHLARHGGDWLGLRVAVDGATHPVVVKLGSRAGRRCLILAAAVAPAADVPSQSALRYNAESEHGALADEAGFVSLRAVAGLDTPAANVAETIAGIAKEAARMRRRLARSPGAGPFAGYID